MTDEILKFLLEEAETLESYAVDAVKEGKISVDDYHQLSLMAMEFIHEEIPPGYSLEKEFAFALAFGRACSSEIKKGIEHNDLVYSIQFLSLGNRSIGMAQRVEIDSECRKEKAKNAAKSKHSQSYEYKKIVWDHYKLDQHRFKSLDQAAEKIISKNNVPYAFRTVRKWLTEFKKLQKKIPPA